jgi:hypothetical protein
MFRRVRGEFFMALLAIAGFTYILFSSLTDENACARGESAACVHFQPSRNHPMVSRSP